MNLKLKTNEFKIASGTSAILMNEPIHLEPAPVRIRHFFIFSLFSSICLCPATGKTYIVFPFQFF